MVSYRFSKFGTMTVRKTGTWINKLLKLGSVGERQRT